MRQDLAAPSCPLASLPAHFSFPTTTTLPASYLSCTPPHTSRTCLSHLFCCHHTRTHACRLFTFLHHHNLILPYFLPTLLHRMLYTTHLSPAHVPAMPVSSLMPPQSFTHTHHCTHCHCTHLYTTLPYLQPSLHHHLFCYHLPCAGKPPRQRRTRALV